MKTRVMLVVLSVCVMSVVGQAAIDYAIPQSATAFATNPTGPWTASYAPNSWSTRSDWSNMVYNGAGLWNSGTTRFPEFGTYGSNLWWIYAMTTGWGDGAGAWVFQCPETGNYSVNTTWTMYGDGGDAVTDHIRVHTALDATTATTVAWEYSYAFPTGSQMVLSQDLSQVDAVQDMFLTAGSYIILEMNCNPAPGYPGVKHRFNNPASGSPAAISYQVPEPGLLSLVTLGVVGICRRRR